MDGQLPANPYAAPQTDVNIDREAEETIDLPPAGLGLRFANLVIDNIVRGIIAAVITGVIAAMGDPDSSAGLTIVLLLGSMLGYYIVLEGAFGRTIGKFITGTRVVRFDGYKPHLPQIIGRTFARFIPFEPFSFLGGSGSGWHDSLSGTRVVRVRR
jgi:uncharacterized RDD family membrane protein YckC